MCKREGIFFGVVIFWLLMLLVEILFFQNICKEYGFLLNFLPITILMIVIVPRHFSKKYNKWLESDLFKKIYNKSKKID